MYTAIMRNGIFRSAERRIGLSFLHLRKSTYGLVIENSIVRSHTEKCFRILILFPIYSKKYFIFFILKKKKIETVLVSPPYSFLRRSDNENCFKILKKFCFNLVSRKLGRCHVDTAIIYFYVKVKIKLGSLRFD